MPLNDNPFSTREKGSHAPGKPGNLLIGNWFRRSSWMTPSEQYELQRTQYYHGTSHADRRWRSVETQLSRATTSLALPPTVRAIATERLKEYFSVRSTAGLPIVALCAGALFIATREHRPQIPFAPTRIGSVFPGRNDPVMPKWEVLAAVRHIHRTTKHGITPSLDVRCILLHLAEHYPLSRDTIEEIRRLWNLARDKVEMRHLSNPYLIYVILTHVLESEGRTDLPMQILSSERYASGMVYRHLGALRAVLHLPLPSHSIQTMEKKR